MLLASFLVTSNSDNNVPGTLRYAITQLNSSPDPTNSVTFSIGSGHQVIQLTSALPTIQKEVSVEGNTQPGYSGAR